MTRNISPAAAEQRTTEPQIHPPRVSPSARNWPLHRSRIGNLEVELKAAAAPAALFGAALDSTRLDSIAVVLFIISLGRSVILSELSLDRRLEGDTNRPNYQTNRISKDVRVRPVRSIRERENELI